MTISPTKARTIGKRSNASWAGGTFHLQNTTRDRLRKLMHLIRSLGEYEGSADMSEVIDQALIAWLDQHEPEIRRRVVEGSND